jgi:Xaa-Pro dipeptidase
MNAKEICLPFEPEEYARKVAATRLAMAEAGIEVLLATGSENVWVLSGFRTGTAHAFAALGVPDGTDPPAVLAEALAAHGFGAARLGIDREGWFFTAAMQDRMKAGLPGARFLEAPGLVERIRTIKSAPEIAVLRAVGAITATSLRAGIDLLEAGVTDREIGAVMTATAIREGGEPMPQGPFVTFGPRSFRAHTSWTGDAIMRDAIDRAGCGTEFVVRAAYGIGLSFGPTWGEDRLMALRPDDRRIVEPGMCFHLVPAL